MLLVRNLCLRLIRNSVSCHNVAAEDSPLLREFLSSFLPRNICSLMIVRSLPILRIHVSCRARTRWGRKFRKSSRSYNVFSFFRALNIYFRGLQAVSIWLFVTSDKSRKVDKGYMASGRWGIVRSMDWKSLGFGFRVSGNLG